MEPGSGDKSEVWSSGSSTSTRSGPERMWEGSAEDFAELEECLKSFDMNKLKKLVRKGAPYLYVTQDGQNHYALDNCAFYSRADVMKLILERDRKEKKGHSKEFRTNFENHTANALFRVCQSNCGPIARMLLDTDTPLLSHVHPHEAARNGSWVVLNELYKHATEPILDTRDEDGYTPLHHAAKRGHTHTIRFLLEKGAAISEQTDGEGLTALHFACETAEEDTIQLLVTKGADVNAMDQSGRTPVFLAAENGKDGIISVLATAGANLDALDDNGNIPLIIACSRGHTATVRELILNGASTEVADYERYNGLERAILNKKDSSAAVYVRLHQDKNFLGYFVDTIELNVVQVVKYGLNETVRALLDRMIVPESSSRSSDGEVFTQYLDLDVDNHTPCDPGYSRAKDYFLQRISEVGHQSLAYHGTVRIVVDEKMKRFGYFTLLLRMFLYLLFLACLSFSLIQAAHEPEPLAAYFTSEPNDLRLACEVFVLVYFLVNILTETAEVIQIIIIAYNHIHDKRKQVELEIKRQKSVGIKEKEKEKNSWISKIHDRFTNSLLLRVFYDYFRDKGNYLDVSGLSTLAVLIALRASMQPTQWVFATITFFINSIRLFKMIVLIPVLGPYSTIIYNILIQDLPRFLMLLIITLVIFTGSFFISLRVPYSAEGFTNTSLDQITTQEAGLDDRVWWVFLSGIRVVLDGDVYQDGNYLYERLNWMSVSIYIAFFFLTVVVYLNVFIAQLSDTYSDVKINAKHSFAWQRLNYIVQLEKSSLFSLCLDFRKLFFIKSVFVDKELCQYYYGSANLNTYLENCQLEDSDLKSLLASIQVQQRVRKKIEALDQTLALRSLPASPIHGADLSERLAKLERAVRDMSRKMDRIK